MNCRFTVGLVSAILVVPGAVAGPAERERARSPSAPDCRNIQEVAKEAVAYSLLGAQEVYTTPACFKNEVFRFFRPEKRERHDEFGRPVWSEIKLFNKRTDHYSIETVKIVDRNIDGEAKVEIRVQFTIGGRSFTTTIDYQEDVQLQMEGQCGIVSNEHHAILRRDCVIPSRLPRGR